MRNLKIWAVATALILAVGTVASFADGPSGNDKGPSKPAPAEKPGTLDVAQLGTMLEGLGCKVEPILGEDGAPTAYKVIYESNGYNYTLLFQVSGNGQLVWVTAVLQQIDPTTVSSEQLMKLLTTNAQIDPAFFAIDEQSHFLLMMMPINNNDLTPAYMRQLLQFFCGNIHNTRDQWSGLGGPKVSKD